MYLFLNQTQIGNLNLLKNKKNPFILFLIFLVCFLVIPRNEKFFKGMVFSFYDDISTYDSGFSSIRNFYGGSFLNFENNIRAFRKFPKALLNTFFGVDVRNEIPKLYLDIKFKNYKKLIEDRSRFIKNDIGFNFTEVKGKILFNDKKINCKVRLKGDLSDHWRSEKRMSLRINVKGDNSVLSFKRFSLQKPSARQHPYDQTFQSIQKELGNISSTHNYVNLIVNGIDWGIMNIEEHMSKELLEKQKNKESLIFEFGNESKKWLYDKYEQNTYEDYLLNDPYLNVDIYQGGRYIKDSLYRKFYTYVSNETLRSDHQIYDINSFSKSLILSLIWNTTHTLSSGNSRYYFNPYDLKIYPITTDQGGYSSFESKLSFPKPYEKIINSDLFKINYNKNLNEVISSVKKSQTTLDRWQGYFPLDEHISTNILQGNINEFNSYQKFVNNTIDTNDSIKKPSPPKITKRQSNNLFDHISAKHFDNGEIHIYNLLNEKLKLKSICVGNKLIVDFENINIDGHNYQNKPLITNTSLFGNYDEQIEIQTEHNGFDRLYTLGYSLLKKGVYNPLINEFNPQNHSFFEMSDNDTYVIKKGNWEINEPIVLNKGLEIEKGTTLTFTKNSYIIVKGRLTINGSKDDNVILKSDNGYWKGLYVLNSVEKSIVKNVSFLNLTNLSDGLLDLTGGITFYKSDVEIRNVKFINCVSEDFLNIVNSKYLLQNVQFENCSSDAFDSDFSSGIISNSTFRNISGDGIDFSGSSAHINNTSFFNIRDKSVSIGEGSTVEVKSIYVENTGVGVAVKDGSYAKIENSNFFKYQLNALMTYTKKSFYSTPLLKSFNNHFDDIENCCLSQTKTELINNEVYIPEKSFNVDSLYQTQIMKK